MVDVPDFDALYAANADPWRVGSSPYEQRKLDVVVACLSQPTYRQAWDTACGTGHLVRRLADRCHAVLATDGSPRAVELTRAACRDAPQVRVGYLRLPEPPELPGGSVDLVVISEWLYYLGPADRAATLAVVDAFSAPDAEALTVHWRHQPEDAWLSGAATQHEIAANLTGRGWTEQVTHSEPDFAVHTLRKERR